MIRRARRRTMTIHMKPHEPIRVTTAMRITDDEVLNFLSKKAQWIEKNVEQFQKIPPPPIRRGEPGEKWMFKGNTLVLNEAVTLLRSAFIVWTDESVTLYWPESQWAERAHQRHHAQKLILSSLRQEAEALFSARVQIYATKMKLFPKRIKLMEAQTRWGSCSSRGNLNFNWRLIGAPIEVIDSIVVHELAHLQHMNHSQEFWELVEAFAPHHDEADNWLRNHQHQL